MPSFKTLLTLAAVLSAATATSDAATTATSDAAAAKPVKSEAHSTSNRVGCAANLNGHHFNLKELQLPIDETDASNSQMYQLDFEDAQGKATIEFNLCGETARKCPDSAVDYANIKNAVGTCNHLSRVEIAGEQKPGSLSLISENNPRLGVVMSYQGGNMCDETSHFSLQVQINCNANLEKTTFALDKSSLKTPCNPRVIMNSPHACPVLQMGPLGEILENYNYYIGIPMLLIGGYLAFVAGKFPGVTLLLFTTLAVCLAQLFALYIFVLPAFAPTWSVLIVFPVTLGMGVGLGYGASKWPKIGIVIMGLSMGSLLGFFVYYMFLASSVDSSTAKVITVGGVALFSGIIYVVLFDQMIITTSAIFGSYILIRGLSMYTGGYVNEIEVLMASSNGDITQVRWTTFLFWALMVITAFSGIKAQLANRKETIEAFNDLNFKGRGGQSANYDMIRKESERAGFHANESNRGSYFSQNQEDESTLINRRRQ